MLPQENQCALKKHKKTGTEASGSSWRAHNKTLRNCLSEDCLVCVNSVWWTSRASLTHTEAEAALQLLHIRLTVLFMPRLLYRISLHIHCHKLYTPRTSCSGCLYIGGDKGERVWPKYREEEEEHLLLFQKTQHVFIKGHKREPPSSFVFGGKRAKPLCLSLDSARLVVSWLVLSERSPALRS